MINHLFITLSERARSSFLVLGAAVSIVVPGLMGINELKVALAQVYTNHMKEPIDKWSSEQVIGYLSHLPTEALMVIPLLISYTFLIGHAGRTLFYQRKLSEQKLHTQIESVIPPRKYHMRSALSLNTLNKVSPKFGSARSDSHSIVVNINGTGYSVPIDNKKEMVAVLSGIQAAIVNAEINKDHEQKFRKSK